MNSTNKTAIVAVIFACVIAGVRADATVAAPQVNFRIVKQSIALHINANGSYSETVTRITQPLTVAGVSEVGHVEIAYPANFATVKVLQAYTETITHKRVPVTPEQIFVQSTPTAAQTPFLSDGRVLSLLYSAVAPGAEVHLKYVERFKHAYLPRIYAVAEVLAPQIPVQSTDISITAPGDMHLHCTTRGAWHVTRAHIGKMYTVSASSSWSTVNFPPLNAAAITQYAPMAVITTAHDWSTIARTYDRLADRAATVTPAIAAIARKVANGARGTAAVDRIYHWVQQNIQSVNVDYAHAGFSPPAAPSTLARGIGDSNATVAVLCALLRARGIAADPAMISPSERFVPYPAPDPFAFDHFLVYVPAYHLFLDPSARYAGLLTLPAADQGRPVLIAGAHRGLTRTPGPTPGIVDDRTVQNLKLTAAGNIDARSTITAAGWHAMQVRKDVLADRSGRRLQRFMQNDFYLSGKAGSLRVISVQNRRDLDKPVRIVLQWHESAAAIPGKTMALLLPTSGSIAAALTPFTSQATRRVPSVLQPVTIDEITHLRVPPDMVPEQLPRDRQMRTAFGDYAVTYRYANDIIDVSEHLQLTKFVISPREYPLLHKLALVAVAGERKALLLRRIG